MKTLCFFLCLFLSQFSTAFGTEPISGGFGLKLGEKLSRDDFEEIGDFLFRRDLLEENHPFKSLVVVTTALREIAVISGNTDNQSLGGAEETFQSIVEFVDERYGKTEETEGRTEADLVTREVLNKEGTRGVKVVLSSRTGSYSVQLIAYDLELVEMHKEHSKIREMKGISGATGL